MMPELSGIVQSASFAGISGLRDNVHYAVLSSYRLSAAQNLIIRLGNDPTHV
ncbi:MAG: hypothetical protein HYX72_00405 [Acidobacteria bacterium]|nr:hypothetical protein [Acidobacteriota bacterium]